MAALLSLAASSAAAIIRGYRRNKKYRDGFHALRDSPMRSLAALIAAVGQQTNGVGKGCRTA